MPMFATSDGTKLYYEDTGSGPTLVFCHGLNSSHLAIKAFIDEFRGEYRCICYVQPDTPLYGDETVAFYRENLRGPFRLETGFPGTTHTILQERPREVAARVKPFLRGDTTLVV